MKGYIKINTSIITLILLIFLFILSGNAIRVQQYENRLSPEEAQQAKSVLVVLQKTSFKNDVADALSRYFQSKAIESEVIDLGNLRSINEKDWNAIIILQTWEDWEPQPEITELVNKASPREKVIVLTTSDTGQEKLSGIDAISSASSKSETEIVANKIIERLEKIINL